MGPCLPAPHRPPPWGRGRAGSREPRGASGADPPGSGRRPYQVRSGMKAPAHPWPQPCRRPAPPGGSRETWSPGSRWWSPCCRPAWGRRGSSCRVYARSSARLLMRARTRSSHDLRKQRPEAPTGGTARRPRGRGAEGGRAQRRAPLRPRANLQPRLPAARRAGGVAGAGPYLCCFIRVHSPPSWGSRLYMYKYPSEAPTSSRGIFWILVRIQCNQILGPELPQSAYSTGSLAFSLPRGAPPNKHTSVSSARPTSTSKSIKAASALLLEAETSGPRALSVNTHCQPRSRCKQNRCRGFSDFTKGRSWLL